jgi:hypothetical protein
MGRSPRRRSRGLDTSTDRVSVGHPTLISLGGPEGVVLTTDEVGHPSASCKPSGRPPSPLKSGRPGLSTGPLVAHCTRRRIGAFRKPWAGCRRQSRCRQGDEKQDGCSTRTKQDALPGREGMHRKILHEAAYARRGALVRNCRELRGPETNPNPTGTDATRRTFVKLPAQDKNRTTIATPAPNRAHCHSPNVSGGPDGKPGHGPPRGQYGNERSCAVQRPKPTPTGTDATRRTSARMRPMTRC